LREILRAIVYGIDVAVYVLVVTIYLYLYVVFKLLKNRLILEYTLWRYRIPRSLRRELVELYDEKIDEIIESTNPTKWFRYMGFNIWRRHGREKD